LVVGLKEIDQELILTVKDDGVGSSGESTEESFGMVLIDMNNVSIFCLVPEIRMVFNKVITNTNNYNNENTVCNIFFTHNNLLIFFYFSL